ncbi:hypothetical protein pb186bvf_020097 [Paramecium bursaria]
MFQYSKQLRKLEILNKISSLLKEEQLLTEVIFIEFNINRILRSNGKDFINISHTNVYFNDKIKLIYFNNIYDQFSKLFFLETIFQSITNLQISYNNFISQIKNFTLNLILFHSTIFKMKFQNSSFHFIHLNQIET